MVSGLFLYGQGGLSDDDVVANFVARGDTLDSLLRRLRAIEPDGLATHHLLIGVRGMGKTTLLRRLAIAIDQDPALAQRFTPLSFREEQYNVLCLGDFWRNCGEALAEWAERTGKDALAQRLDRALFTPDWAGDEEAADQFQAEMEQVGRRAVLLVDNLDLILDALPDADQWILRRRLQARHGPVIVGASTRPLRQTADRDAAFYEFFQPFHLEPLNQRETENCMRALAQGRGAAGGAVIRSLNTQPERLRTLHTLTGGNPRILTLIYRLLENSESDQAMADLEVLLDQVTPFYKARVEEYQTAQQRAVIDAIALHWDPITTNTLAQITNIPATTLSPLLIKLRKDGLIESRETSGSYAGHQLVERFLNIWYLMRHGTRRAKQKMRWLVSFLTSFYSAHELSDIAQRARMAGAAKPLHPDYEVALQEAVALSSAMERDGVSRWDADLADQTAVVARKVDERRVDDTPLREALALAQEALAFWESGDFSSCLEALNRILERFGKAKDPTLSKLVAMTMLQQGAILGAMGDTAGEIATYNGLIVRFGEAEDPALRTSVAMAMVNKGGRLGAMGNAVGAIATYDALIDHIGEAEDPALSEQVAKALFNKGVTLGAMGDAAGEIAAYDAMLARFSEIEDSALSEQVAKALFNKGVKLGAMGDAAGEIAAYDAMFAHFGEIEDLALREPVAKAMVNKGFRLSEMGDAAGAIDTYDALIDRFAEAEDPALREQVAKALLSKGVTLGKMGDAAGEITAYEALLARFGEAEDPALLEQVAEALLSKGITLREMGDTTGAIAAYDAMLARFAEVENPALRELIARARVRLGNLLLDVQGDSLRAEALYRGAAAVQPLWANSNLAWLLLLTGRTAEAQALRASLEALPPSGLALLDAAIELAQDNFGTATAHLTAALDGGLEHGTMDFSDDLERLLRLADQTGYGERLLGWFEASGAADRVAPVYAAFKAYVRGEAMLLDVNPEVGRPARVIYDRLDAPRRRQRPAAPPSKPKRPRGRPRKA
ncbi:hypothetical protein [Azospirillum sp.]|uniref:hypothetical protein n=1 Tax=Azospirillum sp. TaxID=34012 RepID=UPI002622238E|nr:hypothetical protein [Azospirillum sp.]